jgi:DnaK suppressor protein
MTSPPPALDPAFLASQRARLIALRTDLSRSMDHDAEEARQVLSADQDHANEIEDRAQGLTIAENDRILSSQLAPQRSALDRALAKLDEGTYGFSDVSGAPIPIGRLEAFPQALTNISEEPEPCSGTQLALGVHDIVGSISAREPPFDCPSDTGTSGR